MQTPVPTQPASLSTWGQKYQYKDPTGVPIDEDLLSSYLRVAEALSACEPESIRQQICCSFVEILHRGCIPAGRIMANAGTEKFKPRTSLINCTVSGTLTDSIEGILQVNKEAGITLAAGCGVGYCFSSLRPRGAFVNGVGAVTSGSVSFMGIFDAMCSTIASDGGRRGAQMGTLHIWHPDIEEFITAKHQNGVLRKFNMSVLITDKFINAVQEDADWILYFPVSAREHELSAHSASYIWVPDFPYKDFNYVVKPGTDNEVLCKVYKHIKARKLWDLIMTSTYDYAEPGVLFIDKINYENNLWWCEDILATNPCAEQPLPENGACLLGSINLTSYVTSPFTDNASFNFPQFIADVKTFSRMLDNVVELNGLPLEAQRDEITRKRRHGMGFTGLGSTLTMLGQVYGSDEAASFAHDVAKNMAIASWEAAVDLAIEKGPAPIMDEFFTVTNSMKQKMPGYLDNVPEDIDLRGKSLFVMSRYLRRVLPEELLGRIERHGARYTHATSMAPTGTISLALCNNVSNGIEPSFAHHYHRNIIREGKKTKEKVDVFSFELLAYRHLVDNLALPGDLPPAFVSADSIGTADHLRMQAAVQPFIDSSISKTINVATDITFEEFKGIYAIAFSLGLKGCTTFRFNPEVFQGVLVREEDLEATSYEFTLKDGSKVVAKGNDIIEYDGEAHSAANLFDALKEGYYGKL